MQLMLFNSLLMFDIVFIFFLFLIGVTCVLYYLPPSVRKSSNKSSRMRNNKSNNNNNTNNSNIENYESYTYQSKCRRNTYTNELVAAENCDQTRLTCTDNENDLRSIIMTNSSNSSSRRSNNDQNNTYNSEDTVVRINENFMRHTCNCNRNLNTTNKVSNSGITLMQIKPSEPQLIEVEIERTNSLSCYVKAKDFDIRDCNGPVFDV